MTIRKQKQNKAKKLGAKCKTDTNGVVVLEHLQQCSIVVLQWKSWMRFMSQNPLETLKKATAFRALRDPWNHHIY
jgi:hypothetical protein